MLEKKHIKFFEQILPKDFVFSEPGDCWAYGYDNSKNSKIKEILNENAEKKDLLRFFAIGMDSIKVLYNIGQLKNNKNKFLPGDTGYLQLDEFNKIRRNLVIVKFKNGIATNIPF